MGVAGDAGQAGECCAVSSVCGTKKVQCPGTHHCIPHWELCDRHQDCEDGWDEEGCPQQPCLPGQWQCRNRVCIMAEWKCNGIDDCGDSSDEDVCGKQEHWMVLSVVRPVWAMCELGNTLFSWVPASLRMIASFPGSCRCSAGPHYEVSPVSRVLICPADMSCVCHSPLYTWHGAV